MARAPDPRTQLAQADRPWRLPARNWLGALLTLLGALRCDQIWLTAAGLAFCAVFAAIPAAAVSVSIYGLTADPESVRGPIQRLAGLLPSQASGFLADHLRAVASASRVQLGAGLGGALVSALWSALAGAAALIAALNVAYGEVERRSFRRRQAVGAAVALFAALFGVLAFLLFSMLSAAQEGSSGAPLAAHLRWPALAVVMAAGLSLLYRHAPCRRAPKWRWTAPGAAVAPVLWLAGGVVFSQFVASSEAYNKVFGALGVLLMLLTWFYWTAFVVLLGAELNAALEHQTARDTTEGPELPRGRRDAEAADQVGSID